LLQEFPARPPRLGRRGGAKNVETFFTFMAWYCRLKKRQTGVLEACTKQNVTKGPVSPDLSYSKLPVLRVGTDLQDHWQD
jgi:hypothetical protein